MAIFIHLINLIKFNRFSKSNMVTGLTGLTITDVEPVDKVPRYSSQRQLRVGLGLLVGLSVGWSVCHHENSRTALRIS